MSDGNEKVEFVRAVLDEYAHGTDAQGLALEYLRKMEDRVRELQIDAEKERSLSAVYLRRLRALEDRLKAAREAWQVGHQDRHRPGEASHWEDLDRLLEFSEEAPDE